MNPKSPLVALQMYTLRDLAAKDMATAMRLVAEMGYQGIELAGYGNLTAEKVHQLAVELNLAVVSTHAGLDALRGDLSGIIADSQLLGYGYVVCSYLPPHERADAAQYKSVARELENAAGRLRAAGLQLCYHNHDFEFQQFDGVYGLDILYGNSDPVLVQAEIDTYWVKRGGADPAAYILKYSGRVPLLHIKDMAGNAQQSFAEIGAGILDWPAIFAAAEVGGVTSYIVEQDTCPGDPLASARLSIENLKKMRKL